MQPINRRNLLRLAGVTALGGAIPHVLLTSNAFAQDAPQLSLDDPTAKALGYVHDTANVNSADNPNHAATQTCANCTLIQAAEGEWRPCAIFPGKSVNAKGWCKSWVAKT